MWKLLVGARKSLVGLRFLEEQEEAKDVTSCSGIEWLMFFTEKTIKHVSHYQTLSQ